MQTEQSSPRGLPASLVPANREVKVPAPVAMQPLDLNLLDLRNASTLEGQ